MNELSDYTKKKRYNTSTVDLFLEAFSRIYKTKIVVHFSDNHAPSTAIGDNNRMDTQSVNLLKSGDHFDLMVPNANVCVVKL